MKVIVETDRLFLRQMNEDDFDALYLVLADTEICSIIHTSLMKRKSGNG